MKRRPHKDPAADTPGRRPTQPTSGFRVTQQPKRYLQPRGTSYQLGVVPAAGTKCSWPSPAANVACAPVARGLLLPVLWNASGVFPLLRCRAAGGSLHHRLPVAHTGSGGVPPLRPVRHGIGGGHPAVPQRQLLLQRGVLVSGRTAYTVSQAANSTRADQSGSTARRPLNTGWYIRLLQFPAGPAAANRRV